MARRVPPQWRDDPRLANPAAIVGRLASQEPQGVDHRVWLTARLCDREIYAKQSTEAVFEAPIAFRCQVPGILGEATDITVLLIVPTWF